MISSKTLKDFVKMHEYKLNAKINGRKAEELDSELNAVHWGADCLDDRHGKQATAHWETSRYDLKSDNQRPQSRYFNYIMTATHS